MRLLIDLQVLQRPNRLDPWRTCLERLLPALIEAAPSQIAEAYVSTRLSRESGHVAGAVAGLPEDAILARLAPG